VKVLVVHASHEAWRRGFVWHPMSGVSFKAASDPVPFVLRMLGERG
jgi:hypothetical protein